MDKTYTPENTIIRTNDLFRSAVYLYERLGEIENGFKVEDGYNFVVAIMVEETGYSIDTITEHVADAAKEQS